MEGAVCRALPRSLSPALHSHGRKNDTFGIRTGAIPTTVEKPIVVTSRRCYITVATGTAYTVPAGAEISFNGTTWLSANGTTPTGARYWYCQGESSASYDTDVTLTPVLGGLNYPFVITTMVDPATLGEAEEDGTPWLQEDGTPVYQEG